MMLRSFIAIEISPEIQNAISRSTTVLQNSLPKPLVRWVSHRNIHLTLKFLGDVSPVNLELLAQALKVEASRQAAFSMEVGGLGVFPNPRHPHVIWIGIKAPSALQELHRGLETAAVRLGYAPDIKPFSAHLTIGRVEQNASAANVQRIRTALEQTTISRLGTVDVEAIHIFKSDLQSGGSVYTHLYAAQLHK